MPCKLDTGACTLELSMLVSQLRRKIAVCAPYETVEAVLCEVVYVEDADGAQQVGYHVKLITKDSLGRTRELGLFPVDVSALLGAPDDEIEDMPDFFDDYGSSEDLF